MQSSRSAFVYHYSKGEFTRFNYRNLLHVVVAFRIPKLFQSQELHNLNFDQLLKRQVLSFLEVQGPSPQVMRRLQ